MKLQAKNCGQQLIFKNSGINMLAYCVTKVTVHAVEGKINAYRAY